MQALWMLLVSLLFACMGVCVKMAATTHSAIEIVFYRSFLSLIMIFALMRLKGVALATPQLRWQLTRGLVGFTSLLFFFWAITILPLATATTLCYTSAIFLAVYLLIAGWRLTIGIGAALVFGMAGVTLLLKPSFGGDHLGGELIGLASGALAGFSYFSLRELGALREPESRTVFYFSLVSSIGAGIGMLFAGVHAIDLRSGLLLLTIATLATAAQLLLTYTYKSGKTLLAATLSYTTVIFSSLFGVLFWDERLTPTSWAAIGVIILSGIMATHFSREKKIT